MSFDFAANAMVVFPPMLTLASLVFLGLSLKMDFDAWRRGASEDMSDLSPRRRALAENTTPIYLMSSLLFSYWWYMTY